MSTVAIIAIILITVALTTVFYAAHRPGPLPAKVGIAAAGFLLLAFSLWLIGALGV